MLDYFLKRLLALLPTVLVPLISVFLIIRLAPGDPAAQILGDQATPEQVDALREQLGLNEPILRQFGQFLLDMFTLNLGDSLFSHVPVTTLLAQYGKVTVEIGLYSLVIAAVLGVLVGAVAAFRDSHWDGKTAVGIGIVGISLPQFWIALVLVVVFAVNLGWFPVSGYVDWSDGVWPHLRSVTLPALTLGLAQVGLVSRMVRGAIKDVLHEPFVTTAVSLGVPRLVINIRHVMRVAWVEILTIIGIQMALVLSGSVVVENIFALPGMGRLLFDAVLRRDYDVIQGVVLFVGVFIILVNLTVDMLYAVVDPRVRYAKEAKR
jgi:peptide/nickel transport system permease protein